MDRQSGIIPYHAMTNAMIDEVFASIQGEGPWAGQRHIFVRFIGCDLRCGYCDTPDAVKEVAIGEERSCRAQVSARSFEREQIPNPITPSMLSGLCSRLSVRGPSRPVVSLTGGEPLLNREFLREWLPALRRSFRVHLETNGVHHEAMAELHGLVDLVSMDMKLPSATGQQARWEDHRAFLSAAQGTSLSVKVVVTRTTSDDDVLAAVRLLAEHDRSLIFVIQPAGSGLGPDLNNLVRWQRAALEVLEDVRVLPQVHKILGVP